jgi:hypothetical protein
MDILASMLAYLVSVAGIIAALAASFVIFFASPGQQPSTPAAHDVAAMTAPGLVDMATGAQVKMVTEVKTQSKQTETHVASGAPQSKATPPATIAIDARQKPLTSPAQLHRLVDKERAKRFASRANSDFETRFLHYDD